MNIIEIGYTYPIETFIHRHQQALIQHGFPVKLIVRDMDMKYDGLASIQGGAIDISNIEMMPNFNHLSFPQKMLSLRYFPAGYQLNREKTVGDTVLLGYFRSQKPDLIHFHFASLAVNMAWIPQQLGIPYTFSLRGTDVQVLPLLRKEYILELRNTLISSSGVHSVCEALWNVAVTESGIHEMETWHKTIFTVVPVPAKNHVLQKNKQNESFHFVSIGRFHWRKSFVYLLTAFRSLLDHGLDSDLTIIGDGPSRDELVYWIHALQLIDSVKLPGKLSNEEISRLMLNSDAYIQSSIAEGFSNATAEAMALGLPIFATDVGGTAEIIKDGENGFLLDPFKPETWWEKLMLVKDATLMESIGKAAWETAGEFFTAERHARDFSDFYGKALTR